MDASKILEVIDKYENELESIPTIQERNVTIEHLKKMIPQMREFIKEGRAGKAFRWLGFMQGVLCEQGHYLLEELKEHNRTLKPDEEFPGIKKIYENAAAYLDSIEKKEK